MNIIKKAFRVITVVIVGFVIGFRINEKRNQKRIAVQKEYADKHLTLYLMMNQWVKLKQKNKAIVDYLKRQGYQKVAIYGMNYVGETLLDELDGSCVEVKYAIDKNAKNLYSKVDVLLPDDDLEQVDAILITPVTYISEIKQELSKKVTCDLVSIEDILYEM